MHKINFIIPVVFEILELKNPATRLAEIIFAFNHPHLKLHHQFVVLIDMKLHAQNQLYASISFWDIKVLKTSLGMPGYDHTHLNLQNQFITLTDMKLHAQNQLYTSFSFLDLQVLIASLACMSMPDHTHLISHHQFVALIDMYLHAKICTFVIWLAETIFAFNSRTRFFCAWFKPKKSKHQWTIFFCKIQKTLLLDCFSALSSKLDFSPKIWFPQFFTLKAP